MHTIALNFTPVPAQPNPAGSTTPSIEVSLLIDNIPFAPKLTHDLDVCDILSTPLDPTTPLHLRDSFTLYNCGCGVPECAGFSSFSLLIQKDSASTSPTNETVQWELDARESWVQKLYAQHPHLFDTPSPATPNTYIITFPFASYQSAIQQARKRLLTLLKKPHNLFSPSMYFDSDSESTPLTARLFNKLLSRRAELLLAHSRSVLALGEFVNSEIRIHPLHWNHTSYLTMTVQQFAWAWASHFDPECNQNDLLTSRAIQHLKTLLTDPPALLTLIAHPDFATYLREEHTPDSPESEPYLPSFKDPSQEEQALLDFVNNPNWSQSLLEIIEGC